MIRLLFEKYLTLPKPTFLPVPPVAIKRRAANGSPVTVEIGRPDLPSRRFNGTVTRSGHHDPIENGTTATSFAATLDRNDELNGYGLQPLTLLYPPPSITPLL